MDTRDEYMTALRNADAAGDTAAATQLAESVQKMDAAAAKPAVKPVNVAQKETEDNGFFTNALLGVGKNVNDTLLGGKQLINSVSGNRLFDEKKLAEEVAGNKAANEAISGSVGGMVGDIGTSIATSAVPFGAATKAAKAATFLPKILKGILPTAAVGAAQGVLTPDEDYSVLGQAGTGAALNVGGDIVGRGLARVLKPMQGMIPDAVRQSVANLTEKATLLAENITDSKAVKAMTNALAQIPGFGSRVNAARASNLGEGTKLITGAAGHEVDALTPAAKETLFDNIERQMAALRSGPDMPVPGMPAALTAAKDENQLAALLMGTKKPAAQLESAVTALNPSPSVAVGHPPTPAGMPRGQPPAGLPPPPVGLFPAPPSHLIPNAGTPPFVPHISPDVAMDVRRELGDEVFRGEHGISTRGAEAIKGEVEAALRARHGNAFDKAMAESGTGQDITKLLNTKGAVTEAGHIRPEAMVNLLPASEVARPTLPYAKQLVAMGERMASPSLTENRSLMVRALMGAPVVAGAGALGGLAGYGTDNAATGAGVAGGSLGLASLLLGTAGGGRYLTGQNKSAVGKALQSEKAKMLARFLSAQGANYAQGE